MIIYVHGGWIPAQKKHAYNKIIGVCEEHAGHTASVIDLKKNTGLKPTPSSVLVADVSDADEELIDLIEQANNDGCPVILIKEIDAKQNDLTALEELCGPAINYYTQSSTGGFYLVGDFPELTEKLRELS